MTKGVQVACTSGGPDAGSYRESVRRALEASYGPDFVKTVMFYIGVPDEATFPQKLRMIFRSGAEDILRNITLWLESSPEPHQPYPATK